MSELKACPFCGGKGVYEPDYSNPNAVVKLVAVTCDGGEEGDCNFYMCASTREKAEDRWNRRADDAGRLREAEVLGFEKALRAAEFEQRMGGNQHAIISRLMKDLSSLRAAPSAEPKPCAEEACLACGGDGHETPEYICGACGGSGLADAPAPAKEDEKR